MKKKKVLFLTEATYLKTGYSTYAKNILERLQSTGRYEIAELSIYGTELDTRRKEIKWKNYPNVPNDSEKQSLQSYNSNPVNQFGAWRFERVCLDFKPDVVLSIRDYWMDSFIELSPFRRLFNWVWMPTVDAAPQSEEWIHTFANVDRVITYSDWAASLLKNQSGGLINVAGTASPSANTSFTVLDKETTRKELGIPSGANIIGTVMRNQRRKLFPVLFESFAKFLRSFNDVNTYLYCHTSYPDNGWDIAGLLHKYGISSRVLFSYVCNNCEHLEVCHFNDAKKVCPNCNNFSSTLSSVGNGVDDETLAKIYNTFDLYVQCSNCEGFGIPIVEAAACGVPIACTNYSAMVDMVSKLKAKPIEVGEFYKELETGCDRAVPKVESIYRILYDFFSHSPNRRRELGLETRKLFEENYSWDSSAEVWMKVIDELPYSNWSAPAIIKEDIDIDITVGTNRDFVESCVNAYCQNPSFINSHEIRSFQRDLNCGFFRRSTDGFFSSDYSAFGKNSVESLDREKFKLILRERMKKSNFWESVRNGSIKIAEESWLN